jgi:hypothetical protein
MENVGRYHLSDDISTTTTIPSRLPCWNKGIGFCGNLIIFIVIVIHSCNGTGSHTTGSDDDESNTEKNRLQHQQQQNDIKKCKSFSSSHVAFLPRPPWMAKGLSMSKENNDDMDEDGPLVYNDFESYGAR